MGDLFGRGGDSFIYIIFLILILLFLGGGYDY